MSEKKTTAEKLASTLQFMKDAFCVDGDAILIHDKITFTQYIQLTDSKRGIIKIGMGSTVPKASRPSELSKEDKVEILWQLKNGNCEGCTQTKRKDCKACQDRRDALIKKLEA
jgi:hypothetical protein